MNEFTPLIKEEMREYHDEIGDTRPYLIMPFGKLKATYDSVGQELFTEFMKKSLIQTDKKGFEFIEKHAKDKN